MEQKDVVILGAGISGLAIAYWLKKEGLQIAVLERKDEPGGAIESVQINGYLFDRGPNSGLETTPLIREIARGVGVEDRLIYASEAAKKRYIYRAGELHPLPMGPLSLLTTRLFSWKGKLRVLAEPFIGRSEDGYYQSVADFVRRRLGKEFLDYAINPFVAGIFAGDPEKLSVQSAFPRLYRLEEVYGSLIKGMVKGAKERKRQAEKSKQSAEMFSFKSGLQEFATGIAGYLHDDLQLSANVIRIEREGSGYRIVYRKDGEDGAVKANTVVSAVPAYVAARILGHLDPEVKQHLESIEYPPVLVLFCVYPREKIAQPLDGFGYLIPEVEKQHYLGALWSSTIFDGRAPAHEAAFTIYVGGARQPELLDRPEQELVQTVLEEFERTMGIEADPVLVETRFWEKAIPQYNLGYIEHVRCFERFERENPGLFLAGNYIGGISLGDCVRNSRPLAQRVISYLRGEERSETGKS